MSPSCGSYSSPERLLTALAGFFGLRVERDIGAHRHRAAGVEGIVRPVGTGDDRLVDHDAAVVAILREQLADRLDRLGFDIDGKF